MTDESYTRSFTVAKPPGEVFAAAAKPRAWWSEDIDGVTDRLGAIFYYHYQDIHRATLKVAELVPGRRIVWRVLQNYFNFIDDQREWTGTDLVIDVSPTNAGSELRFTHRGLVPSERCYQVCHDSWNFYLASLESLINTGTGQPNKGEANANPTVVPEAVA